MLDAVLCMQPIPIANIPDSSDVRVTEYNDWLDKAHNIIERIKNEEGVESLIDMERSNRNGDSRMCKCNKTIHSETTWIPFPCKQPGSVRLCIYTN